MASRAIALLLLGFAGLVSCRQNESQAASSAEAKEYIKHLKLAQVEMQANENALGQRVVEITGTISNAGERPLKMVAVNCVFSDAYGQLVLRHRVEIVRAKFGGLKQGETKPFRLPFDNLPQSWNQSMPQLVIAEIVFG